MMPVESMISKIKIIQGDCSIEGLGLSAEDRKQIIKNCTLIYHCAATIRFDEKLKRAVELNTRGTLEMIKLALECKKLDVSYYFFL
jgi:alcohol-forming fatty acyl-CoA reductase